MKKAIPGLMILCWAAALGWAQSVETANVSGDWTIKVATTRGVRTSDVNFVQDGEKLTVTMTNPQSGVGKGQGTIKGVDIEWSITRSSFRVSMTFSYKGNVEGDTMSGEIKISDSTTGTWTATRKKA